MPPKRSKHRRSRNGCQACKKAKIKCDEAQPICSNCAKAHRECDYSVKLIWGGRPYKKPRVEKLNKIAAISRDQLKQVPKTLPLPFHQDVHEVEKSPKATGKSPILVPSLSPGDNLNFLLNMTDMPEFDPLGQIEQLEHSYLGNSNELGDVEADVEEVNPEVNPLSLSIYQRPFSILRGLSPLPELLRNSSFFHESFNHYVNLTYQMLTPADSVIYTDNPFKQVLPRIAMKNNGILSLLVAFGALHRGGQNTKFEQNINKLVSHAMKELLCLLNNKETAASDITLCLTTLFISYLLFMESSGSGWRIHYQGALQLLLMRGLKKPFSKLAEAAREDAVFHDNAKQTRFLYFLVRWFAYIDVFSKLSSPLQPNNDEMANHTDDDLIDYELSGDATVLSNKESHKEIDYLLGFNVRMIPYYSKLCQLIKYTNILKKLQPPDSEFTVKPSIIEHALTLEHALRKAGMTEFDDRERTPLTHSYNMIVASNRCYILMGLIQLYRRVFQIPRSSPLIQELSNQIVTCFQEYIDTSAPSVQPLILTLFIGGCESLDATNRDYYRSFMTDLFTLGAPKAKVALAIMEKCWLTGRDWYEIMDTDHIDHVFL